MAVMTFLKKGVMRNPFPCAATPSGCGSGALEAGLEPFERKVEDYRVGVFPPHKAAADRSVLHPDSPEAAIGSRTASAHWNRRRRSGRFFWMDRKH
jgi:hypothetical protein